MKRLSIAAALICALWLVVPMTPTAQAAPCLLVTLTGIQSGEIAERRSEDSARLSGGPAELVNVITFDPKDEPQPVWSSGEVKVSAIRSTHIAGHASYRVDTPAGSVVIGGDAGNDTLAPPRSHSTSDQVEKLAKGADIIVHSTMHPVMGPDHDSGMPPPIFIDRARAPILARWHSGQVRNISF